MKDDPLMSIALWLIIGMLIVIAMQLDEMNEKIGLMTP